MKPCPEIPPANPQYRDPSTRQVTIHGERCVEIGAGKWLALVRDAKYWKDQGNK